MLALLTPWEDLLSWKTDILNTAVLNSAASRSVTYLPILFIAFIARRRQPTFVLGFLLATLTFTWAGNLPAIMGLSAYLLARDFGHMSDAPERQHVALLGCGLMAGFFVFSLSFDIAATLTYEPAFAAGFERGYFDHAITGFVGDPPAPRWTRMLTEAALIVACLAHRRGRTWGVLVLAILVPALAVQVRQAGIEYPFWSYGCSQALHPFRDTLFEQPIVLLTLGPWLWPMLRALIPSLKAKKPVVPITGTHWL